MEFTHRGRRYRVERDEVVEAMRGEEPEEATQKHRYYVKIGDNEYPIKQIITKAVKLPKAGFTSMDAYRILERLGFEIIERSEGIK